MRSCAVNYEHISEYKDKEGRFVTITGKIEGMMMSLFNVYVPPGSDRSFYEYIFKLMYTKSQRIVICGGDFNIRLNPKLDSSNGKSEAKNISKRVNTLMNEIGTGDVWREANPIGRGYTHYLFAHTVYSQLDYFFTFKKDLYRLEQCETGPSTLSDHNPMYMSVHLDRKFYLLRLNSNILNNPAIKKKLKVEIKLIWNTDNKEVMPSVLWDALKAIIRGKTMAISSYEEKIRQQKCKNLDDELKKLRKEHSETFKGGTKSKILEL